jgi:hypothetical protein
MGEGTGVCLLFFPSFLELHSASYSETRRHEAVSVHRLHRLLRLKDALAAQFKPKGKKRHPSCRTKISSLVLGHVASPLNIVSLDCPDIPLVGMQVSNGEEERGFSRIHQHLCSLFPLCFLL